MNELLNKLIKPDHNLNINTISGIKNLIRLMNQRGFTVTNVKAKGYFYTSVAGEELEVASDSRANLKPRNRIDGLLVACMKVYLADDQDWELLSQKLGLNYPELLKTSQKSGIK